MITVVIPTFNRAELLPATVNSAAMVDAVTCILIVDDGSTDDTPHVVKQIKATYAGRIRYERLSSNQGAQVARNRGLSLCETEMISFLDSDDLIEAQGYSALFEVLDADQSLSFVYGRVIHKDLESQRKSESIGMPFSDEPVDIAGYHWHTLGALYRCSFLNETVGDWNTELLGAQDWEYQARVKIQGRKHHFIDQVVGVWHYHQLERIGTTSFRASYTLSVISAAYSIYRHACKTGKCDRQLGIRLSKIITLHALELGAHGLELEKKEALVTARAAAGNAVGMKFLLFMLSFLPGKLDGATWHLITKLRSFRNSINNQ